MRHVVVVVAAALVVAALAAGILGEYEFQGVFVPAASGLGVGFVVAEIFVSAGRWRGVAPAALAAGLTVGSLLWAGWIDSGEGVEAYPPLAGVAAGVGAVTAAVVAGPRGLWRARS